MKIFSFLAHCLQAKRPNTARRYRGALDLLCRFLVVPQSSDKAERAIAKLKTRKAVEFVGWLRSEKYADATGRNTIAALREIYRELVAAEVIESNPFASVRHPVSRGRVRQVRPTKLVPFDRIKEILQSVNRKTFNGVVEFASLALLFGGGLRRSEVLGLRLGDVGVTPAGEMFLRIRDAKTGERSVSLPKWAWEAYSELVQRRRKDPDASENPDQALVFVRYRANGTTTGPVSESTFYRRYKRILAAAGLPGYAPHSARATFATRLLAQGIDAITVSRALGHVGPEQVITYDKRFSGPDVQPQRALDYK